MSLIDDSAVPYALIASSSRSIGTIIPEIVVEEVHQDDLTITDHPVESGGIVSDHAFAMPAQVEMHCGFSNSTAQEEGYVQQIYQVFLALQAQKQPFDVITGKRQYPSMLIRSLRVVTDAANEFALNIIVALRHVLISSTQSSAGTGANVSNGNVTPTSAGTAALTPSANIGTQTLTPASGAPSFTTATTGSAATPGAR